MKLAKSAALAVALFFVSQAPAQAQTVAAGAPVNLTSVAVGLVIIGAAFGIGMLAKAAVESMARQPEVEDKIRTVAIILAALIEGVTLLALIILGFILK